MAIYLLSATVLKRSVGRSATASAAYRAAERIDDERSGQSFDYTRKRGVLHSEIMAPAGTPAWMQDRAQLWNAVEAAEKRKDSQLAREVLLSLPHELTADQRRALVQEFVRSEFVSQGMIADIALHAPHRRGDERNFHAHVLLTMRELTGDGFGKKAREWNAIEQLEGWRENWAATVNRHLERAGHAARVDHRSLEAQGIDREPEPKQGPIATELERQGRASHAGDDRRAAQARNAERAEIAAEMATVTAAIIDLREERLRRARRDEMENHAIEEAARRGIEAAQDQQRRQAQQVTQQAESRRAEDMAREHADHQVRQAEQMREQRARLDAFEVDQKRQAEQARQEEERRRESDARGKAAEGEIHDAGDRYRMALGQHYDIKDPYGSLSRAAMAEYGAFIRDRQQLDQQIAKEQDAEARKALELRKEIEAADYMAITSRRIAGQSEVITGRRDSEEALRFRDRADNYETQGKELRQQYRDLAAERAARESDPTPQRDPEQERSATKEAKAAEQELTPAGREITDDKAARIARIREQGRQFESAEKARENSPTLDRGRSR